MLHVYKELRLIVYIPPQQSRLMKKSLSSFIFLFLKKKDISTAACVRACVFVMGYLFPFDLFDSSTLPY